MARLTLEGRSDVTRVPARCAWLGAGTDQRRVLVVKGTPGSHGDAGWTVFECRTPERAADFVAAYPQAAMPCWRRFEVLS